MTPKIFEAFNISETVRDTGLVSMGHLQEINTHCGSYGDVTDDVT